MLLIAPQAAFADECVATATDCIEATATQMGADGARQADLVAYQYLPSGQLDLPGTLAAVRSSLEADSSATPLDATWSQAEDTYLASLSTSLAGIDDIQQEEGSAQFGGSEDQNAAALGGACYVSAVITYYRGRYLRIIPIYHDLSGDAVFSCSGDKALFCNMAGYVGGGIPSHFQGFGLDISQGGCTASTTSVITGVRPAPGIYFTSTEGYHGVYVFKPRPFGVT